MNKEHKIVLSRLLEALSVRSANWFSEDLPRDLFDGLSDEFKSNFTREVISSQCGEEELKEYGDEVLDDPRNPISLVLSMYAEMVKE